MICRHRNRLATIFTVCCLSTWGCLQAVPVASEPSGRQATSKPKTQEDEPSPTADTFRRKDESREDGPLEDGPSENDYPELENLIQVSEKIYSGGEPHSDDAFASLVRLGVKTVVSVDGAKPSVKAAHKHGLRYVHIAIGYDGVRDEAGRSLAGLVRDAEGPFYIHCHHGRHRGPAAAAIACIATEDMDGKGAIRILERAGTSKEYAGLWRDVENYQPPCDDVALPELVEVADVGSLAAAMAQIDRVYDNLKLCRDAQWSTPKDAPDLVPPQEALLLKEALRESARTLADEFSDEFRTRLTEAESIAQNLEDSLKAKNPNDELSQQFQALENSCRQCHEKHRD